MKSYKTLTLGAVISSLLLAASFSANAATTFTPDYVVNTSTTPSPPVQHFTGVGSTGWVSPSMSYKGWVHQSKWIFLDVVKGKTVTITLDGVTPNTAGYTGFHPGLTVWNRHTNVPASNAKNYWMDAHFYKQGTSINVSNAKADKAYALNGQTVAKDASVGNIIMDYVTSAYDADGLGDKFAVDSTGMLKPATATDTSFYGPYLPAAYTILGASNGLSDATPGKLTTSFTAPVTGVYQIAIGGVKPDVGSTAASCDPSDMMCNTGTPNVDVTITVN